MIKIVGFLNGIIWSKALIYLCLGVGVYFSVVTRFLQVRHFKHMLKLLFVGESSEKGVSSFQALAISISGRVGTGNIAGVATAIALGGPGALFWMWMIAFLGAGSAFVESVLAQLYKTEQDGQYRGGPAYYIEKGLKMKGFALAFAIATFIAVGILMPGTQSNSISAAIDNAFGISPMISGGAIILFFAITIFGGVKRIGRVAELVAPFMAAGYILMALIIIGLNIDKLPGVIGLVFSSAFNLRPAFSGIFGMAIAWGVKRGIYSNEAGQGTGPHPAAAAEVSHPAIQGLVQAFSVYIDTLFVCSATGFMILITGMYNVYDNKGGFIHEALPGVEIGPAYTQAAVESVFPAIGPAFVAVALTLFAFTSLLAYYYIAECNAAYLEKKFGTKGFINALRVLMIIATYYGSVKTAALAWGMADLGVGLMAWMNIVAIVLLRKPALAILKDYEAKLSSGRENEMFDPRDIGVEGADFWEKDINRKAI